MNIKNLNISESGMNLEEAKNIILPFIDSTITSYKINYFTNQRNKADFDELLLDLNFRKLQEMKAFFGEVSSVNYSGSYSASFKISIDFSLENCNSSDSSVK